MSQGIVKVTPKKAEFEIQVEVTVADPNPYDVKPGDLLSFPDPGFSLKDGNDVNCTITSSSTCKVDKILAFA